MVEENSENDLPNDDFASILNPNDSDNPGSLDDIELEVNSEKFDGNLFAAADDIDLLDQVSGVYKIWCNWAFFQIEILTPNIDSREVVEIIHPELVSETNELEFVYPIFDYGNVLSTSKGSEMYTVGASMCKFYYTIEKMIAILIKKLKDSTGEDAEIESEISFDGHQLGQRKAFESVINLNQNVVVTNFDPGEWGEKYLQIIKKLSEKGYGYPPEAPRYNYRAAGVKTSKINKGA
jgi:hypothetical protein